MNILVIGNGFDLAHGLPTKYVDFLKFCSKIVDIYDESENDKSLDMDWLNDWATCVEIKDMLRNICKTKTKMKIRISKNRYTYENKFAQRYEWLNELYRLIENNSWIEYFNNNRKYQKENWIDFESEIHKVIKGLDYDMLSGERRYKLEDSIKNLSNNFLRKRYLREIEKGQNVEHLNDLEYNTVSYKQIRDNLQRDLDRLTRALEIYLVEVVEKLDIHELIPEMVEISIDHVLSFNYTDTYEKLYGNEGNIRYDYIHGRAVGNNTLEKNNMVMGIDEYLSKERKDVDVEFIGFKKFYQRIHKETGSIYKEWLAEIVESGKVMEFDLEKKYSGQIPYHKFVNDGRHRLYVFGHSLDATDGDILRDLILNDNVYTTIFFKDKRQHGQQIANLVRVIGQDELIRRTGGITKTIEFRLQENEKLIAL